jgi:CheY-like chemotaxis protein
MNQAENASGSIVLVEDNPADVYLVRRALQRAGVTLPLVVLTDGAEALHFVQGQGDGRQPCLIILDLNLPKNDGTEVLAALEHSAWLKGVPVAVLTTSRSPRDRSSVERHPTARFISKPVELDDFLQIGEVLRQLLASVTAGTGTCG